MKEKTEGRPRKRGRIEREREGRRGRERRRYIAPCNEWGPSENRATDTVPETHTRDGNYPGRFSGARWLRTIDDRFYLFSSVIFFALLSLLPLSPPALLRRSPSPLSLALSWVNCSWDSSGSHSGVNSFAPPLTSFLHLEIYRIRASRYLDRFTLRFRYVRHLLCGRIGLTYNFIASGSSKDNHCARQVSFKTQNRIS